MKINPTELLAHVDDAVCMCVRKRGFEKPIQDIKT